ncbi:hypothetical protein BJV78DRAFT_1228716 [Lactifluus subvellereus]|nr:hypothetical protein BJV78DRAFT_1228716 [Lactifluus subvellereus]
MTSSSRFSLGLSAISWSQYSFNCTKLCLFHQTSPSFPNPIPDGTRVPQWALLDVTIENNWNSNTSFAVRDSPEITPGTGVSSVALQQSPLPASQSSYGCEESARRPRPPRSWSMAPPSPSWVKSGRQGQSAEHTGCRPCLRRPPHL